LEQGEEEVAESDCDVGFYLKIDWGVFGKFSNKVISCPQVACHAMISGTVRSQTVHRFDQRIF